MDQQQKEVVSRRIQGLLAEILAKDVTTHPDTSEAWSLTIRVVWPAPLHGRPNAHGTINVVVSEEALADCFLRDEIADSVNDKFKALIRSYTQQYTPVPTATAGASPEPTIWNVTVEDLC